MELTDVGTWLIVTIDDKGNYSNKEYHIDNPEIDNLKFEKARLLKDGRRVCNFRVSTARFMWVEDLDSVRTSVNYSSTHINHRAKTHEERVDGLVGKVDLAIDDLILIKSVLKRFNKN